MNTAARNRFVLPRTPDAAPRGRLILPKPRKPEPNSDSSGGPAPSPSRGPRLPAPQAYVPYASQQPYGQGPGYLPADTGMLTLAIVGLALTTLVGLPAGLFTGVSALKRAKRVEHLVRIHRRPASDASTVSSTRVAAWISIVWSVPLLLLWAVVLLVVLMAL